MLQIDEAKSQVLKKTQHLPEVETRLEDALGLVLSHDVTAPIDLPPFDNSAMDGFAVSSKDVPTFLRSGVLALKKWFYRRNAGSPERLLVSQTIKAGDTPAPLQAGTCAKIMTGAPTPDGADTVVPIEDVKTDGDFIIFDRPLRPNQHIRLKGEDIKCGAIAASRGTIIQVRHIALLAALGLERVTVHPRPRVTIISTGNELNPRGTPLKPGNIYDSNTPALTAALKGMGIAPDVIHVRDDKEAMAGSIQKAIETSDVLITIGGVSVGDYDYVKAAVEELGGSPEFWRVAIKPGKPVAFWTAGSRLIFGLPGNPVSCIVTFDLFVRSALLRMMGRRDFERTKKMAVAAEAFKGSDGKTDLLRGICSHEGDRLIVKSSGLQGSAILKSFADANCMIIIPPDKDRIEKGESVEIELYDDVP